MTSWVLSNSFYKGPGLARLGQFHLLKPFSDASSSYTAQRRNASRPKDLPEYFVHMTRKSLYAATTSLSRVTYEVHDFFLRISQMLAFERMMRSFWAWGMPITAPWLYGANQFWLQPVAKKPPLLPFWGSGLLALPAPQANPATTVGWAGHNDVASMFPSSAAVMATSAAMFTFGQIFMQSWGLAA